MASATLNAIDSGFARVSVHSAWQRESNRVQCGAEASNECRNYFRYDGSPIASGLLSIDAVQATFFMTNDRANYYPDGAVWPVGATGQGAIGTGTFAAEFADCDRANEYATGITAIGGDDNTLITVTLSSAARTALYNAIIAGQNFSICFGLENDTFTGNGAWDVSPYNHATPAQWPALLVTYTAGGGGGGTNGSRLMLMGVGV